MKYLFLFLCLLISCKYGLSIMSEKQLAATKKLVRNTCTNKVGVAPEKVEGMYKGDFDFDDKPSMCYLHCMLMTYKLMKKDNTFDWEEGVSVIEAQAPPRIANTAVPAFKKCKDAVRTKSKKCKAAMEIAKCVYDVDPPNYFFP